MAHKQEHIQKLLEDRYYLRDEQGELQETDPKDIFVRVSVAVSKAEEEESRKAWAYKFFKLMEENKFLPNTPILINAGKERAGCFSACFVIPVEDSMDQIFEAVKQSALIMKAGGGIGYNFGRLREEGAIVKSTGQKSGGPLSFMKSFDAMCDTVKQGGSRRGAMMAVLPIWHPDIEKFIELKADGVSFSNFNISVGITDDFMGRVKNDESFYLIPPQDVYDNKMHTVEKCKVFKARYLWNKIIEQAWKTGDPGLVFLDTINKTHPLTRKEDVIEATNPCGEIPLRPYESCNLGSINLMAYVKELEVNHAQWGLTPTGFYEFDWDKLAEDIPTMVRFLDDVIEVNPFPLPEIEKATKESRKIGLGVMGWADVLIKMKISYDSQEALELAGDLMRFIDDHAYDASVELAKEKGAFPLWEAKKGLPDPRRNATLLCVAPTGTISRIAGVSSGIEPIFAWETHHKLEGHEYNERHWVLDTDEAKGHMFLGSTPNYCKTANEIDWADHLRMQAAFQKYVDNSISKTINLPNSATEMEVNAAFSMAYDMGLKGITIYRDGSKDNQPLNKIVNPIDYVDEQAAIAIIKETEKKDIPRLPASVYPELQQNDIKVTYRKRGPIAVGITHKVNTGRGKIYITINYSEYHKEPVEVFIRLGHAATPTENALAEWTGRLISIALKYGIPAECVIKQGNKVFSDATFWYNQKSFTSLPQLISYLLGYTFEGSLNMAGLDVECFLDGEEEGGPAYTQGAQDGQYCYNCGNYAMINQGGCFVCTNCGFEKCS